MRAFSLVLLLMLSLCCCALCIAASSSPLSPPTFNVLDYGAKGDNITDDSAAVQKALDALAEETLTGGIVLFPRGVYLLSKGDTINFFPSLCNSNTSEPGPLFVIKGEAEAGASVITWPTAITLFNFSGVPCTPWPLGQCSSTVAVHVNSLSFQGSFSGSSNAVAMAASFSNLGQVIINNVVVQRISPSGDPAESDQFIGGFSFSWICGETSIYSTQLIDLSAQAMWFQDWSPQVLIQNVSMNGAAPYSENSIGIWLQDSWISSEGDSTTGTPTWFIEDSCIAFLRYGLKTEGLISAVPANAFRIFMFSVSLLFLGNAVTISDNRALVATGLNITANSDGQNFYTGIILNRFAMNASLQVTDSLFAGLTTAIDVEDVPASIIGCTFTQGTNIVLYLQGSGTLYTLQSNTFEHNAIFNPPSPSEAMIQCISDDGIQYNWENNVCTDNSFPGSSVPVCAKAAGTVCVKQNNTGCPF